MCWWDGLIRVRVRLTRCSPPHSQLSFPNHCSAEFIDLVSCLLQVDERRRCGSSANGAKEVQQHQWFRTTPWLAIFHKRVPAPIIPKHEVCIGCMQQRTRTCLLCCGISIHIHNAAHHSPASPSSNRPISPHQSKQSPTPGSPYSEKKAMQHQLFSPHPIRPSLLTGGADYSPAEPGSNRAAGPEYFFAEF